MGLNFNPSDNSNVDRVKKLYAEIIDILADIRDNTDESDRHPEKNRYLSTAITEAQSAQMWAVKGIVK